MCKTRADTFYVSCKASAKTHRSDYVKFVNHISIICDKMKKERKEEKISTEKRKTGRKIEA